MDDRDSKRQDALDSVLQSVRRQLRRLTAGVVLMTVAVVLMGLALFLTVAVVFGYLLNYYSFDPSLLGGVTVGAAILGFVFGAMAGFLVGWLTRGRR